MFTHISKTNASFKQVNFAANNYQNYNLFEHIARRLNLIERS